MVVVCDSLGMLVVREDEVASDKAREQSETVCSCFGPSFGVEKMYGEGSM